MSTSLSTISWLPEDLTGSASTNYVVDEVHKSETTGSLSRFVIIPAEGAFYDTTNLRVVYHTQTSDTVLIRDNDYRLVGLDFGRTKVSTAQGGVYHFILITTVFNYDPNSYITIDYQAFGGYMSSKAYSILLNAITEMEATLAGEGVITANNIASNETIQIIVRALQALCARLNYAPTAKYLMDTSFDGTVKWFTIATSTERYDAALDFSDASTLCGNLVLCVTSKDLNFKANLSYDLTSSDAIVQEVHQGRLKVDVLYQSMPELNINSTGNAADAFFTDGRTLIPKFRIVSDQRSGTHHPKVYVQMALISTRGIENYPLYITDSTDLSMDDVANKYVLTEDTTFQSDKIYYLKEGTDSYSRYVVATVTPGAAVTPNTYYELTTLTAYHNAQLASNFTIQTRAGAPSIENVSGLTYTNAVNAIKDKVKIWEGNVNLAFVEEMSFIPQVINTEYNTPDILYPIKTAEGYPAIPFIPDKCIEPYTIKQFVCDIYDRYEQELITVRFPARFKDPFAQQTYPPTTVSGSCCYFTEDNAFIYLRLTDSTAEKKLNIYARSGTSSRTNQRFDLRTVYIA